MSLGLLLSFHQALALTNNVALTPPMGWNDWNAYHCGISESAVTNNANVIASNGMESAGYQYVDIDDGWASSRNTFGVIQAYTNFPDGMAFVANYVHSKGLKLGVYTDDGTNTCSTCISTQYNPIGKDPGSYGYEYLDAFTYASWGADYLKDDNCNAAGEDGHAAYGRMSDGLIKSGRSIVLCLCGGENGNAKGYESWSPVIGNYWRTTGDIGSTFASMISHLDQNSTTAFAAGPGRWNDPDMLEIGNGEFAANFVAAQTHFTMWCEMAAPLIAGDNLTTISPQSLAILTNSEAIAVDQDPAGEQGVVVGGIKDAAEVWSKPLGYDFTTRAVAFLNRNTNSSATITCYWTNLDFQAGTTATVRDLWAHQDLGTFTNSFTATVPPYGSMLLKIIGTPMATPTPGTNFLSDLQPVYAYTGFGTIVPDKSIGGKTIALGGLSYAHGVGVNSRSGIEYNLGGICSRFQATIGVDNEEIGSGSGSVDFHVYADGKEIYNSGFMYTNTPPQSINLDVTGVRRLTLGVGDADDGINYDHADWANACVVVTNTTPQMPEAPQGLAASPGNAITLTWNNALAALAYNVKRATISGGPYSTIAQTPVTTFTDSNVVSGTAYYYAVSGVSSFGEGSNSMEVAATSCTAPVAPTNVTATVITNSTVMVDWNSSPGATSYAVSRFTGNTAPLVMANGLTTTNFTDTNAVPGTIYYYLVSAANDCSQSSYSALAAASVMDTSLPPSWNGGSLTDNDWTDAANWNGVGIVASNTLIFDGNTRLDNTNDTPANTLYSAIDFNPGADTFVLNGNPLTLGGSISNNSFAQQVIALGLDFHNNISFNGTSNMLLIAGGLTNTLAGGSTVLTLTGNGILKNLLFGGTNTIVTSGSANWTLLDGGSSTAVPWVFSLNSGTFNFGSSSSAPVMRTTTPNNVPSDNQAGDVSGATGIFNLVGGILTTASRLNTATALDSTGIVNQVGGTFNLGSQFQGANGANAGEMSIVNLSGGTMNIANGSGPFYVASRGDGILNLGNSASLNCGTLDIARNAAGNTINCSGTVNLDGGTLAVSRVSTATANAQTGTSFNPTATFNFNGGILKANNSSPTFFQGNTVTPVIPISAIVRAGGAIIDDSGFSISFLEPLQHDNSLGSAPDGGLTKNGPGTVTLASGATYNGNTVVNSGTLAFANDFALPSGAATIMAINKSTSPSNAVIQVAGNLTYAGTLMITNTGAIPFLAGDSFKLFSAVNYLGNFTNISPAIPGINLAWNTNALSAGILSIVSTPTPPPKFGRMGANGSALIFSGSNGISGWPYYVLSSTNPALPLTNWTIISTSAFDAGGNFNFTNPANPTLPQMFYLLRLQ
ncbi:MAG TPA: NPCBM/NEW2 domain-containing protein [Verrucomicrobiae bacterium]